MRKSMDVNGFKVTFDPVPASFEGDPSVPGGTKEIPAYAADIEVFAPDGTDITDWMNSRAMDKLAELADGHL